MLGTPREYKGRRKSKATTASAANASAARTTTLTMAFRPPSFSDGLQGAPHKALGEPLAVPGCARSRHAWGREGERSPVVRAPHGRGGGCIVGGAVSPGGERGPRLAGGPGGGGRG